MNKNQTRFIRSQSLSKGDLFGLFQTPFCIINKKDSLLIHKGKIELYENVLDLPPLDKIGANYISMLPFCQIKKEKDFEAYDEGEKIITLRIQDTIAVDLQHFKSIIPEIVLELEGDVDSNFTDIEFEDIIRNVIENEIKNGEGSNFLMSRKFFGQIKNFNPEHALSILRRLIENEAGSYWNFLFYTGVNIFVGASPERLISISDSTAVMNPISGTIAKAGDNFDKRLEEFMVNPKEINELFQVLDEELKIICKLCPEGGKVIGPFLKEMSTLVHTEYLLEGYKPVNILLALKETLYAATMVGSPLQNATRIIKKYEKDSRKYYSSVICVFGKDKNEQEYMDNAITIRTVEIEKTGKFTIQCGNSIVRDSIPEEETKELQAKAQGLINAMLNRKKPQTESSLYSEDLLIKLKSRNKYLSNFWLKKYEKDHFYNQGINIDLIDNEDDFIYMIRHVLDYIGYNTNIYKYYDYKYNPDADIVVIGPGPGDPNNLNHDKIAMLYEITHELLKQKVKILGVCLGHQILLKSLGYELFKADIPFQGLQKEIDLFGEVQNVGFYNSYFAMDNNNPEMIVSKSDDGKIFALRGPNCASYQFHFESVLTQNGIKIINDSIEYLLTPHSEAVSIRNATTKAYAE